MYIYTVEGKNIGASQNSEKQYKIQKIMKRPKKSSRINVFQRK